MMAARSFLLLSAVAALLGTPLVIPTFAFRAAPSTGIKKHGAPIPINFATRQAQHQHRGPVTATTTLNLSSPDELHNNNKQEQEMTDEALREQQSRQVQQEAEQKFPLSQKRLNPFIASLTRNDESTPIDTRPVPLFGEVAIDGSLVVLVPAAVISVLGFIFSIVVALNSGDSFVQELSEVDLPETKNNPTVVVEQCRGLCSSQDENLDGLRNFMESITKKD